MPATPPQPTEKTVAIVRVGSAKYPAPPYDAPERFPELATLGKVAEGADPANLLYGDVRRMLHALGLDSENFGAAAWNPLRRFVGPGQNTVIKPNLVLDHHPAGPAGTLATVSNAAVIRPLIDYILLATSGVGRISICDVPLQKAN